MSLAVISSGRPSPSSSLPVAALRSLEDLQQDRPEEGRSGQEVGEFRRRPLLGVGGLLFVRVRFGRLFLLVGVQNLLDFLLGLVLGRVGLGVLRLLQRIAHRLPARLGHRRRDEGHLLQLAAQLLDRRGQVRHLLGQGLGLPLPDLGELGFLLVDPLLGLLFGLGLFLELLGFARGHALSCQLAVQTHDCPSESAGFRVPAAAVGVFSPAPRA